MQTKLFLAAAAAILATTASAQTATTTVKKTTTETAPAVESEHHTTTTKVTTVSPDGVVMKNGVWMKGNRRATTSEISTHKQWLKTQTTTTTVKTDTPS